MRIPLWLTGKCISRQVNRTEKRIGLSYFFVFFFEFSSRSSSIRAITSSKDSENRPSLIRRSAVRGDMRIVSGIFFILIMFLRHNVKNMGFVT